MLQNEEHSDVSEDQSGKTPLIDSAFFKCDRQATCTHVVKFKETKKFGIILGYDQLAKIKEKVSVWKKEAGKDMLVESIVTTSFVPISNLKVTIFSYLQLFFIYLSI